MDELKDLIIKILGDVGPVREPAIGPRLTFEYGVVDVGNLNDALTELATTGQVRVVKFKNKNDNKWTSIYCLPTTEWEIS